MSKYDYRNQFKASADCYDKSIDSRHITLIYELEKAAMLEIFKHLEPSNKTVMDFACGTGRWTQFLQKHFKHTVGVDVSENMVAHARDKTAESEFIVTDITSDHLDDRLKDRQFDVITAFRFYKNAQPELREAATNAILKYLKPGGLFIFDLHLNSYSFMGLLARFLHTSKLQKIMKIGDLTVRTISLGEIRRLFCNTSLKVVDYYGMGILPGRRNYTILPKGMLYKIEHFCVTRKLLRQIAYNLLVVSKKDDE